MTSKTLNLVQPFERQGKRLVAGRLMDFKTPEEATGRAERDARRFIGVVAVQQSVDTETSEVLGRTRDPRTLWRAALGIRRSLNYLKLQVRWLVEPDENWSLLYARNAHVEANSIAA